MEIFKFYLSLKDGFYLLDIFTLILSLSCAIFLRLFSAACKFPPEMSYPRDVFFLKFLKVHFFISC